MSGPITIPAKQISFSDVEVSERGVSQLSHGKRTIFIPKEQIKSIEIRFGSRAERPLIQTILGALLVGLGVAGVVILISAGYAGLRWGVGFLIFGGLGGFCLYEVLRKGYYLKVMFSNDARKLLFNGAVSRPELSSFIKEATHLGYSFRDGTTDRNII
jgi:hypothetical protein